MVLNFNIQDAEIDTKDRALFYLTDHEFRRSYVGVAPQNGLYFMLNNKALLSII